MKTQIAENPILPKTNESELDYFKRTGFLLVGIKDKLLNLSLSDLISLHGWIDSEADLIESLGGDNTAKLEQAREQMILVHQEIEGRRGLIFGGE